MSLRTFPAYICYIVSCSLLYHSQAARCTNVVVAGNGDLTLPELDGCGTCLDDVLTSEHGDGHPGHASYLHDGLVDRRHLKQHAELRAGRGQQVVECGYHGVDRGLL